MLNKPAFFLFLFLIIGCSQQKASTDNKELIIYSGAGLKPPVEECIQTFEKEHEIKLIADYAGSEVLLSKIKLIKSGDIYIPGDKQYIEAAAKEGFIQNQKPVCYFIPTIFVQKNNPKNIQTLQDLFKPGIQIGVGNPKACAIGRKTKKIFEKNNILWKKAGDNIKFQSVTVNELGIQIETDSLDAVIVWDAIAQYYNSHGETIMIPVKQNIISTVNIGSLTFSKNKKIANLFLDFVVSEKGKKIFKKHNYSIDIPE